MPGEKLSATPLRQRAVTGIVARTPENEFSSVPCQQRQACMITHEWYHAKNTPNLNKRNPLSVDFQQLSGLNGWGTRTRTRKGRTRICSVTITPYPKLFSLATDLCLNCGCKGTTFSATAKTFWYFFLKKLNFFGILRCNRIKCCNFVAS